MDIQKILEKLDPAERDVIQTLVKSKTRVTGLMGKVRAIIGEDKVRELELEGLNIYVQRSNIEEYISDKEILNKIEEFQRENKCVVRVWRRSQKAL